MSLLFSIIPEVVRAEFALLKGYSFYYLKVFKVYELSGCRIFMNVLVFFSANDPWNTLESDGPSTQIRSGSAVSNDPWTTAVPLEASIDPFSPMAQNQLAEFDLMRDQMEHHLPQSEASGFRPPNSNGGIWQTDGKNGNP